MPTKSINNEWLPCDDNIFAAAADNDFDDDEMQPKDYYDVLTRYVYKQDEACKAASIILWNHLNQRRGASRNVFVGPAGCGKTFIWSVVREHLYENVIIYNSANITKTGFTGSRKVSSPLHLIPPNCTKPYIIVYDEFDKLCRPQYTSHDENVSAGIQSEFLALIQPSNNLLRLKSDEGEYTIDVSKITWVFCGSFAEAAEDIARKSYTTGLGFGAVKSQPKAFTNELTMRDLENFGVIPELCSRMTRLVNLRPLDLSDYIYLLSSHPNSPLTYLEDIYDMPSGYIKNNIVSSTELLKIAEDAFNSGLGVRSCTAALQRRVDNYIYENYHEYITC